MRPKNPRSTPHTLQRLVERSGTLGSKCLVQEVKCPPGVDLDEWIASKCVEIFDELNLLAGCIQHLCTPEMCPKMAAGATYEWLWADGEGGCSGASAERLNAPDYFKKCLTWADDKINDVNLFPIDPGMLFPEGFRRNVRIIFKRFFRLYAHVYYSHFPDLMEDGAAAHLNYHFKHFLFVTQEFSLIRLSEMDALKEMVDGFMRERDDVISGLVPTT